MVEGCDVCGVRWGGACVSGLRAWVCVPRSGVGWRGVSEGAVLGVRCVG